MLELSQPGVVVPEVGLAIAAHQLHVVVVLATLCPGPDTENVVTETTVRPVVPVLVPLLAGAVEHEDQKADIVLSVLLVQAELVVIVPDLPTADDVGLAETGCHVLQVPVETLASHYYKSTLSPV